MELVPRVHIIGPLIKDVVLPPLIEEFNGLVRVSVFTDVVVKIPLVRVKTPETELAPPKVLAPPPEMVKFLYAKAVTV